MGRPVEISIEEQHRLAEAYEKYNSFEKAARALLVPRGRIIRAVYRLQGRCDCGAEIESGFATCATCRARSASTKQTRYERRKASKLCVRCGQPLGDSPSTVYCNTHRLMEQSKQTSRWHERRKLGLCPICGNSLDSSDPIYCSRHAPAIRKRRFGERKSNLDGFYGRIIERDGAKCVICGGTKPRIEVHHIRQSEGNDPSNLITMCLYCHHALTFMYHCSNIPALIDFFLNHSTR